MQQLAAAAAGCSPCCAPKPGMAKEGKSKLSCDAKDGFRLSRSSQAIFKRNLKNLENEFKENEENSKEIRRRKKMASLEKIRSSIRPGQIQPHLEDLENPISQFLAEIPTFYVNVEFLNVEDRGGVTFNCVLDFTYRKEDLVNNFALPGGLEPQEGFYLEHGKTHGFFPYRICNMIQQTGICWTCRCDGVYVNEHIETVLTIAHTKYMRFFPFAIELLNLKIGIIQSLNVGPVKLEVSYVRLPFPWMVDSIEIGGEVFGESNEPHKNKTESNTSEVLVDQGMLAKSSAKSEKPKIQDAMFFPWVLIKPLYSQSSALATADIQSLLGELFEPFWRRKKTAEKELEQLLYGRIGTLHCATLLRQKE
mmetsp:Transcript_4054/g.7460  ORF Transcript_4054/g.7460 Transcript_4054/m.7460 type:complete len:364 (+) Transcript_4054:161-1252(+)